MEIIHPTQYKINNLQHPANIRQEGNKMPEKDPASYTLLTYAWVLALSILGGTASFFGKIKAGAARWFNIAELVGEVFISAFAGVVTFYLCEWSGFAPLLTAVLVAVAGHMGTRAIFVLEQFFEKRILGQTSAILSDSGVGNNRVEPENNEHR